MTHTGPSGERPMLGGFGIRKSALRDEYLRQFFRQVDAEYGQFTADDPLPLALVRVVHQLAPYQKVASSASQVITTMTGSHDRTSAHELGKLVWPLVEANLASQRNQVLAELDAAVSARTYASGIGEVWRMANQGRGSVLLVE